MDMQNLPELVQAGRLGPILWAGIGVLFMVFCVYSAILLWHWKEYSTGKFTTVANMFIYLGVGTGFLILMVIAATWYSFL